jgi:hypothetical protein
MKHQSKFTQKQDQEAQFKQEAKQDHREFANSDELLRFDASKTVVPPEIAQRLSKSAIHIPPPDRRPWWRSWFGG